MLYVCFETDLRMWQRARMKGLAEARNLRTYSLEAVRATHDCKEEDIEYFFGGGECRVCHVWVADPEADHD